jgi:hypothetical protein
VALDRWQHLADSHCFSLLLGQSHQWLYRGQIVPRNQKIEVEAVITRVEETPQPTVMANGFLKVDGVYIYQMDNFGISLIPINNK